MIVYARFGVRWYGERHDGVSVSPIGGGGGGGGGFSSRGRIGDYEGGESSLSFDAEDVGGAAATDDAALLGTTDGTNRKGESAAAASVAEASAGTTSSIADALEQALDGNIGDDGVGGGADSTIWWCIAEPRA